MGSSPFLEIILQQYCDRYGHSSLKFVYRSVILWDVPYLPRGEQKRSNRFAVSPEADLAQLTAPTQKIRSSKNIRGLKAVGFQISHLLPVRRRLARRRIDPDFYRSSVDKSAGAG